MMMKEINKLEFYKNNKVETDYIKVYDRSLQKEKIIPIKNILWNSSLKLEQVIKSHWEGINELGKRVYLLEQENKEMKELLNKIWEGLNAR